MLLTAWSLLFASTALAVTPFDTLGNLAPYHAAPKSVQSALPSDCKVEQVMLMGRHGSRYPLGSELVFITGLVQKLANHTDAIKKANLPRNLQFLKDGYTSTLGTNDLTAPGRLELFKHGVDFKLKYPNLPITNILAGYQDRVIESAQWFAQGYFGREWASLNATAFSTIAEDSVTVSWITPANTCKAWKYDYGNNATITWGNEYLPPITARLNRAVPGVGFTDGDTHGALYACAYDYAAHQTSPWCGAFTQRELDEFEYELDLLMDGAFGYNLPNQMGPVLGSFYVNKLIERFTNGSQQVYAEFGHDTTIDFALTGLGLAKDTPPLNPKGPVKASRKWRTSYQVPFGAQAVFEKFTCTSSFNAGQPQIRLVLNDETLPLTTCAKSGDDKRYGTCCMSNFIAANQFSQSIKYGDATYNASCAIKSLT